MPLRMLNKSIPRNFLGFGLTNRFLEITERSSVKTQSVKRENYAVGQG